MPQLIDLVNRYYNPDLSGQYESYRPAPPPQREVDPRKALESDEIPFEVFQELQRRFRAMPKRSPERRYGIVEATDPKTGKGYKWDRYAAQREQGFRPRRDWGHIRNAFKYEGDRRRGILQANLGADAEERAEAEKAFANEVAGYKYEEQLKALGVEEHNKNLDRAATARHRRGVQQAAMEAARQLARHRATMLETPRAVHPEQLDLWRSQTEYNRGGRGRTGDPTYAQEDSLKLAARRDQIMTTIDEIEAGIAAVEGMAPGAIRSRIFKPSREVGIGKYTESVGYDEREDFVERYKDQLRDLKAEQRTIELELYRRGEGPAPGGPGGAPNPTPTVAVGSRSGGRGRWASRQRRRPGTYARPPGRGRSVRDQSAVSGRPYRDPEPGGMGQPLTERAGVLQRTGGDPTGRRRHSIAGRRPMGRAVRGEDAPRRRSRDRRNARLQARPRECGPDGALSRLRGSSWPIQRLSTLSVK
jgi:hypothetical protein